MPTLKSLEEDEAARAEASNLLGKIFSKQPEDKFLKEVATRKAAEEVYAPETARTRGEVDIEDPSKEMYVTDYLLRKNKVNTSDKRTQEFLKKWNDYIKAGKNPEEAFAQDLVLSKKRMESDQRANERRMKDEAEFGLEKREPYAPFDVEKDSYNDLLKKYVASIRDVEGIQERWRKGTPTLEDTNKLSGLISDSRLKRMSPYLQRETYAAKEDIKSENKDPGKTPSIYYNEIQSLKDSDYDKFPEDKIKLEMYERLGQAIRSGNPYRAKSERQKLIADATTKIQSRLSQAGNDAGKQVVVNSYLSQIKTRKGMSPEDDAQAYVYENVLKQLGWIK